MNENPLNEEIMKAVEAFDVKSVEKCLKAGADPNYKRIYDLAKQGILQPETPLMMVMFRISDCMLDDTDLIEFSKIAKLLLQYGADPKPAMLIAEQRYGIYKPDMESNPFTDVWHIIANASSDKYKK